MPADILQRPVMMAGISDAGVRPVALGLTVDMPYEEVPPLGVNHESVKIYHHVTQPPLRMDTFRHGAVGVEQVLRTVEEPGQKTKEDVVVVMRDPLLQKETLQTFDFCSDLPDMTLPPFSAECIQRLFRGMGGLPAGRAYPTEETVLLRYNTMQNLGTVKRYFHLLASSLKSEDSKVKEEAMMDLFGISSPAATRAPFHPGVEVFWFIPVLGQPNQVAGLLKRTIETDLVQFDAASRIPQLDGVGTTGAAITMLQLTDVRAKQNVALRFGVTVDH